jgi:hypothetical protein
LTPLAEDNPKCEAKKMWRCPRPSRGADHDEEAGPETDGAAKF